MMSESKKPVSRISKLREQANLTQAQLAALIGVTTNTIQNWESGKSGLDQIIKYLKLCALLDCELSDLVEYEPASSSEHLKPEVFSLEDLCHLRQRWGADKRTKGMEEKTAPSHSKVSLSVNDQSELRRG